MTRVAGSQALPGYYHWAFGLTIHSCLPLPEVLAIEPRVEVDVVILEGPVPEKLPDALECGLRFQAAQDRLRLQVDGVACYLVCAGRQVIFARDRAADDDEIRAFLLGAVFGGLLRQRGDLVLGGSAIDWAGQGVLFTGLSGVGKSTLAAAFRANGHAVLTDEWCVVRPAADDRLRVYPGFPQLKLWLDSLRQLAVPLEGLRRVRPRLEKWLVPLGDRFGSEPLPVKKIYVLRLSNEDQFKLTPVTGARKFPLIESLTHRLGGLANPGYRHGGIPPALALARQTALSLLHRPTGSFRLRELVAEVEADLRRETDGT